jgi:glycosyltransferase 2 family protein
MSKKIKSALQFTIFLGLGLFLVYYAFKDLKAEEIGRIKQSFIDANYWWIGAGFVLSVIAHLSRAFRWILLLEPTQHQPKLSNSFMAVMVGYLANLAFPRLGEVSRCTVLAKNEEIPFTTSFGTVITERLIDTITWLLLLSLTIILQFGTLFGFVQENVITPISTKFSFFFANPIVLPVFAIAAIIGIVTLFKFRKRILAIGIVAKVIGILRGFIDGLLSIKDLRNPKLFIAHSIFIWLCYILTVYVSTFAMPQVAGVGFGASVAIIAFATFAVAATQGGIGAYPLLVMQVLFLYGVDKISGLAFGWIIWTANAFLSILFGFLSLIILPIVNRKTDKATA